MRILIVDDSKAMRMILARTLRQAGYDGHDVVQATNGREALDLVRDCEPDLVISDWNMPEMSGIELLTALRCAGFTVPFGFVTSESSTQSRELAASEGATFLIAKPFSADDFSAVLDGVLT